MSGTLQALYMDILKYKCHIDSYNNEPNGNISVVIRLSGNPSSKYYHWTYAYILEPAGAYTRAYKNQWEGKK